MINVGTMLGILNVFISLLYLGLSAFSIVWQYRIKKTVGVVLYVIQAIVAPLLLLGSGVILIFQGWRLDPILQLAVFCQNLLVFYLGAKDIYLMLHSPFPKATTENDPPLS